MVDYRASQVVLRDIVLSCFILQLQYLSFYICDLDRAQGVTIAARLNVFSEAGSAYWMLTPSGYQPLVSYTAQSFLSSLFCFRVRVEATPH